MRQGGIEVMKKVIQSCSKAENVGMKVEWGGQARLEVITAALAWSRSGHKSGSSDAKDCSKIFYLAESVSEIDLVVKELKSTTYDPKISILSKRDYMCVNSTLSGYKGAALACQCKHLTNSINPLSECQYKSNLDRKLMSNTLPSLQTLDIEDLHSFGKRQKICPFYLQQSRVNEAEIIFACYKDIFKNCEYDELLSSELENSIII